MRKKFLLFLSVTMMLSVISCSSKKSEEKQNQELSEWQKNVMLSENLPLDEEQLTELQKTRLNSIFEMENYLREKYNEEYLRVNLLSLKR